MNIRKKTMGMKKTILITILLFSILSLFRFGWIVYHWTPEHPHPKQGYVDLSQWEFNDKQTITLDGEWLFYPNKFVEENDITQLQEKSQLIKVPDSWSEGFIDNETKHLYGYGTYYLKVKLPKNEDTFYGLRFNNIFTSAKVFVNGKEISHLNDALNDPSEPKIKGPIFGLFSNEQQHIEIIVHSSNFEMPMLGGITGSVKIGTDQAIIKETNYSKNLQVLVSVIYLLHMIYAFIVYYFSRNNKRKEVLYYGLFLLVGAFAIAIDDDIILQLPFTVISTYKLLLFLFITALLFVLKMIEHIFNVQSKLTKVFHWYYILLAISVWLVPVELYISVLFFVAIYYLLSFVHLFYETTKVIREGVTVK